MSGVEFYFEFEHRLYDCQVPGRKEGCCQLAKRSLCFSIVTPPNLRRKCLQTMGTGFLKFLRIPNILWVDTIHLGPLKSPLVQGSLSPPPFTARAACSGVCSSGLGGEEGERENPEQLELQCSSGAYVTETMQPVQVQRRPKGQPTLSRVVVIRPQGQGCQRRKAPPTLSLTSP